MKVMLLGSGGREHALAFKLSQSRELDKLYIMPGNAGTAQFGKNLKLGLLDFPTIARKCIERKIDMLIVGPEARLVEGIRDYFEKHPSTRDIMVVGPDKVAAGLEGSKHYAKKFMKQYKIPTAAYMSVNASTLKKGLAFLDKQKAPFVLKADGLAGGKGVLICEDKKEAEARLKEMLDGKFGKASETVLIEEFLRGIEMSVFVLTDGKNYQLLPEAKDYKRVGEKDTGLNTGGMGAVSPVPFATEELMEKIETKIIQPTIRGINRRKLAYTGFVFFGLMIVENEPYVIEYNVRMGDPEAEVVLPRIKSDLLQHLHAACTQNIKNEKIQFDERAAGTVMLTSGGYPESYEKGKEITGLDQVHESLPFHAGTEEKDGRIYTAGGRVLALTSMEDDIKSALRQSYAAAEKVKFDKKYYRKDIGFDL
ncbi:MAG: phosphoribosylamine--glycine ligase [Bacteroidota bacterium]